MLEFSITAEQFLKNCTWGYFFSLIMIIAGIYVHFRLKNLKDEGPNSCEDYEEKVKFMTIDKYKFLAMGLAGLGLTIVATIIGLYFVYIN